MVGATGEIKAYGIRKEISYEKLYAYRWRKMYFKMVLSCFKIEKITIRQGPWR